MPSGDKSELGLSTPEGMSQNHVGLCFIAHVHTEPYFYQLGKRDTSDFHHQRKKELINEK